MTAARTVAVTFDAVGFTHRPRRRDPVEAVAELSFAANEGEITAIIGPNGCGKSTLLELACGMLTPDVGRIDSLPAALMPQQDLLLPWAGSLDNAALALRAAGSDRESARSAAAGWFERLGLTRFEESLPHELSGGMRQRVAFVRTLLSGRQVIALDEPFSALDALTRIEARGWLRDALSESSRTALLVTHDVSEAIALADRVIVLSERPARVVGEFGIGFDPSTDPVATAELERRILAELIRV